MEKVYRWEKEEFVITTDKNMLDISTIHQFLTQSHWAKGINQEVICRSIEHSLTFGLFHHTRQVGFARFITDFTTFGYFCDVFILDSYQGLGLGRWLMTCCMQHPLMAQLRRVMLVTTYASWLYEKVGYLPINKENFVWEIVNPNIYQ
ncbi:GNAT family N-acetyltransferase [Xenorhabdus nematophila]|uniref:GNAT family N-acetyltransferase n=1 Tax=Xenorhabdus nematophila TaxID=628 RepID=UPI0032B79E42